MAFINLEFNNKILTGITSSIAEGVTNFKGIRYASTHNSRWQPSITVGVETTTHIDDGAICPQNPTPLDQLTGNLTEYKQHEECLNLNISTSSLIGKKPVMVWIHGGGFIVGGNVLPSYQGDLLAKNHDVVVVSINYRLGPLGFLRLIDTTDGMVNSTGNEGLLDQIEALKWIRKHIGYFGGDKDNITLFGESAGAMSIACLLAMPSAKNLFHKAILQSGAGHTFHSKEKANLVAKKFVDYAAEHGVSHQDLSNLAIKDLMAIYQGFISKPEIYLTFGILPFKPVVGDEYLPIEPYAAIAEGSAKDVRILAGTNADEWTLFALMSPKSEVSDEELTARLTQIIPQDSIATYISCAQEQLKLRKVEISNKEVLAEIYTNFWFHQPCHRLLKKHFDSGGTGYRYTLAKRTVLPELRCTHIVDIGYVFGFTSEYFHGNSERVAQLVKEIQLSWCNFARKGNPSTSQLQWPTYQGNLIVNFDEDKSYVSQTDIKVTAIWEQIADSALSSF